MKWLLAAISWLPVLSLAQTSNMRVYTVAGNDTATFYGDGGPATNASLSATEGIWFDNNCNLYISDMEHSRVRKVDGLTGIITTIAGTGNGGNSGDGGPATNAQIAGPYGLYADVNGNVYFADYSNNNVRRVDGATGTITTFAGGGSSSTDGIPVTASALNQPHNVYGDAAGNIYIAEVGRIRKVDATTHIITTIAGTGVGGYSGDGGPATTAQIGAGVAGMVFDADDNLIIADRNNSRIRKIDAHTGIITTIAGTNTFGYSGDGGPATNAELRGPISICIDRYNNLVIGDNVNNLIRKVDASTGIITTIAGVGMNATGSTAEGALATTAEIHPEFLYLDLSGNIYYSNYGAKVRKVVGYNPGIVDGGNTCGKAGISDLTNNDVAEIFPNPTAEKITIRAANNKITRVTITSLAGKALYQHAYNASEIQIDVSRLPPGMYLLELEDENGQRVVRKVVKE